ncbi:DEAD-domain-containing protein [Vararia minispora EC-137]|uniref:DEAD-domain-containing protein n=1 Tax=Vararia minispora EC-137 TaxID=1314806 RepID=A0ACB8QNA6_9AGAM|nr:DEAD-domain-containing protein [Vararia minispora EC-137]
MALKDFIMTIDSDEEGPGTSSPKAPEKKARAEGMQLDPSFTFGISGDLYDPAVGTGDVEDHVQQGSKLPRVSVDDIIAKRLVRKVSNKRKREEMERKEDASDSESNAFDSTGEDESEDNSSEDDNEMDDGDLHNFEGMEEQDVLATSDEEEAGSEVNEGAEDEGTSSDTSSSSENGSEAETTAEKVRKAAFFASESGPTEPHSSFLSMNLSRPVWKALTTLGFHSPTPIQAATIPVGLLGKDVVGNAVTGSGKTAAFMIPMIERLLYRDRGKKAAATRCVILVPTRELAAQCYDVGKKLAMHTDIQYCLIVGGLSLKAQETALRTRPDVLVATPGRLIDHLRNSPSFTLDALDILVLDEADRMLSDGFADELGEIIKSCPVSRQTMLFSATMTDSVDELIKISLNKPVRLFVDPKRSTARGLVQEFVRVRAGRESDRSALLVALCQRTFKSGVIIFLRSKKLAHQMRIVFGLLGTSCEELHGDLSQEQRLQALQRFRDGKVDFLMATDLASRGLDIKGIETVINYDMPGQLAQYLHRVGRTARAGKKGRSVTLVGEADRKMLKAAIKHASGEDQVRHRTIPPEVVAKWAKKLEALKGEVAIVMQEERVEKQIRQAEMELTKGQNMIKHESQIFSRPARTWFQSSKDKLKAEILSKKQYEQGFPDEKLGKDKAGGDETRPKRDKLAGLTRRAKRRKLALEDESVSDRKGVDAAIRSAKKATRPTKIGLPEPAMPKKPKLKVRKGAKAGKKKDVGTFEEESGRRTKGEGVRAKKGDAIGGTKKGGRRKGT